MMAYKRISTCDECEKEAPYNKNYSRPNDWIGCEFESNGKKGESMDFCSKECLIKYIASYALGNSIGHQIKDNAVSEDSE